MRQVRRGIPCASRSVHLSPERGSTSSRADLSLKGADLSLKNERGSCMRWFEASEEGKNVGRIPAIFHLCSNSINHGSWNKAACRPP